MIRNHDRSGWIGASDTAMVMGDWSTPTFARWWRVKLGIDRSQHFATLAMMAGTAFEHKILEHIGVPRMDRQVKIHRLRLRVNLDGETWDTVKEVKPHKGEFRVSKAYFGQAQVEMYATGKRLDFIAYRMEGEDYKNCFRPIDPNRLSIVPVAYDPGWIADKYLPRLSYLAKCLKKGVWPDATYFG